MQHQQHALTLGTVLLTAILLAGCATPATRIRHHPKIYSTATLAQQALISKGKIALGFTPELVRLALGKPDRVTQHTDRSGTETVWHYIDYRNHVTWAGSFGFGYPFYPLYGPFFGPDIIVNQSSTNDRLRVTFNKGQAVDINRLVRE